VFTGHASQVPDMTSQSLAPPRPRVLAHPLLAAVPPLAAGLLALGLLFHEEAAAALTVWLGSTAYNHCVLVVPIAAYLVWDRRAALSGVAPRPAPLLALAWDASGTLLVSASVHGHSIHVFQVGSKVLGRVLWSFVRSNSLSMADTPCAACARSAQNPKVS